MRLMQLIWFSLPLLTKTKQSLIFLTDPRGQMLVSIETKRIHISVTPLHRKANNCSSTVCARILVIGMGNTIIFCGYVYAIAKYLHEVNHWEGSQKWYACLF